MTSARKNLRVDYEKSASQAYANHVLSEKTLGTGLPRMFKCSKPDGSGMYSFTITFIPAHVIITGDIDSQIFRCNDYDSLQWLLGAVNCMDYVLGKAEHKKFEFNEEQAEEQLKEWAKDGDLTEDQLADLRDYKNHDDALDEQTNWLRACYDACIDDPPNCNDFDCGMQYDWHALRKFVELYQAAQQKLAPAEAQQVNA
jgi:hypothetical protein